MQQVDGVGMVAVVRLEAADDAWGEEDVGVAAEDRVAFADAEKEIARGGGTDVVFGKDVAALRPAFDERLGVFAAIVVDHDQLGVVEVLVEAERLDREVDPVEVVVRRHADS